MSTRKYGMRGPVISNDRHKQTPLRSPAPQNPTAPGVITVPNPYYGSSISTQPQYMVSRHFSEIKAIWLAFDSLNYFTTFEKKIV